MKKQLSSRVGQITPSATLAINARAKELRSQGVDIISFAVGEPDFNTPEVAKKAGKQAIDDNFTRYTPANGIIELKEAICERFKARDQDYAPNHIIITCGGKHALYGAMQALLDQGDEVLLPSPYWVSFPEIVKLAGGVPVIVPTKTPFKLRASDLEKKLTEKTKLIIINSPSNPTGAVFEESELRKIAELAVKNDLYVISDEVYEDFLYGREHVSIASFNDDIKERTIIVKAVSKSYAMTGWRIGYCAGPVDVIKAMSSLQSHMTSNPASISQKAALAALTSDQESVKEMVKAFDERRSYMVERLNTIKGIDCPESEGAFYAFPDVSGLYNESITDSVELSTYLLEEAHIAVVPGAAFGADNHIRFSYAVSMEDIKKGLDRLEEAVENLSTMGTTPQILETP